MENKNIIDYKSNKLNSFIKYALIITILLLISSLYQYWNIKFYINYYFLLEPFAVNFSKRIQITPKKYIISKVPIYSCGTPNKFVTASKNLKFDRKYDQINLHNLSSVFLETKTNLYVLKNVYGNDFGSWACNDLLVYPPESSYHPGQYLPTKFTLDKGNIIFECDSLLLIGHQRCQNNYGHFLADKCVSLMLLPDEIKKNSYIIGNSYYPVVNEGLLALGFHESQIINMTFGDWFFAKKLYVLNDYRPMNCLGGPAVELLRRNFFTVFQLDLIPAYRYGLVNRSSHARNILNFVELFNMTKMRFPNYDWEIIIDYAGNLSTTAKLWTSFRFIYCIVGSSATKGLFMKPYTVMCIPFCNFFDYTLLNLLSNSLHAVKICSSGMKMFQNGIFPIIINESLDSIADCLYYDEHKKWPA